MDQFDFEKKVWVAPADNMKGLADGAEHTMPLGDRAIRFLEALKRNKKYALRLIAPTLSFAYKWFRADFR